MRDKQWFNGKNVLVIGLAKSGMAAAKVLKRLGARVTVNEAKDLNGSQEEKELQELGIRLLSGGHPLNIVDEGVDYVVKNPGIRYDTPIVKAAVDRNLPVVTEIELADIVCEGEIAAITGSNGKTTTTMLVYEMLQSSSVPSYVAGNIGKVACEVVANVQSNEVMVTEVSSFQLKGTETFHPRTAVLLNIFDAHLDYHGSREDYERSKAKIIANMGPEDTVVYNAEDPVVVEMVEHSRANLIPFSLNGRTKNGAYIENGFFCYQGEQILPVHKAALPGRHNQENMLAAMAAAVSHGAALAAVEDVLLHFDGVPHRLQFIGSFFNREVYNDSKSTNILSTQKAVEAFQAPVILLAGGLDRGNSFDDLIPSLKHVKAAVFYGETKGKLGEAAMAAGVSEWTKTETLEEAVREAFQFSGEKDVLLLSPACASWDQFKTFEERGHRFIQAVENIQLSHLKTDTS
ncbi:UDP-N-acetylmuramoyl-L-alanine--D-glutamate ligase [Salibacterium aidingense]|uniref:UDP-N-acetylmuramoyl-L-alanine--D-glutamate ligase n=1 Tax=Salibacterium aidingense TaxID=384933 RepID=UPI0004157829|nr:UDP-N-acetylmuramoyl-L-alanine--D-glutamate ligase [Salibacterium aidingense]